MPADSAPRVIDKVAWIHIEDGRILAARSRGKDLFYLPGGKREQGESDVDTLVREVAEELSVTITPASATTAGVFEAPADGKSDGVLVRMSCYTARYHGTLAAGGEIAELAWLGIADRDRISAATRIVFDRLHAEGVLG
ncbi:DNA mismatch repair protein MutT [Prauserella marina]|uniref:ADP-ribose pyrophosphatase YjhB, NUDIX family n=1 Tax=Prauserella marina TaxID=530584 RepID=A0A222VS43_9PSEU|nr:NUDIX domain-containing protein [Prauserella marina]ASR36737.1 DNA mismatch repair protein MutT [Prauserella marina]PWV80380.1 ADP-ribose pyrophosphatase YjhB (NUDIX family) [Prauserella marina]SDD53078.1 ADP-ribose pyrophosphatase YjhB, NUDIX family [Prauserella marina]